MRIRYFGGWAGKLRGEYIKGLHWCYLYYYQGVQSWTWFFPFHYAPFASDLVDLHTYDVTLTRATQTRTCENLKTEMSA